MAGMLNNPTGSTGCYLVRGYGAKLAVRLTDPVPGQVVLEFADADGVRIGAGIPATLDDNLVAVWLLTAAQVDALAGAEAVHVLDEATADLPALAGPVFWRTEWDGLGVVQDLGTIVVGPQAPNPSLTLTESPTEPGVWTLT